MPFMLEYMTNSTQTTTSQTTTTDTERLDLLQTLATHRQFLRTTARDLTDAQAHRRAPCRPSASAA